VTCDKKGGLAKSDRTQKRAKPNLKGWHKGAGKKEKKPTSKDGGGGEGGHP